MEKAKSSIDAAEQALAAAKELADESSPEVEPKFPKLCPAIGNMAFPQVVLALLPQKTATWPVLITLRKKRFLEIIHY